VPAPQQPFALVPLTAAEVTNGFVDPVNRALLPAMMNFPPPGVGNPPVIWRNAPQLYCDGAGDPNQNGTNLFANAGSALWGALSWEDDLIMTNVRSFDVKAYDNSLAAYADLGWGDDPRVNGTPAVTPWLTGNWDDFNQAFQLPCFKLANGQYFDLLGQTFAHEGRMPPLVNDNRLDAQYPNPTYVNVQSAFMPQYGVIMSGNDNFDFRAYSSNIGDDSPGIVRLRRVWDSWSTEYSQAPANGVYFNPANNVNNAPNPAPYGDPLNGFPWGPNGGSPPIYPSYPAPYPAQLRGIQIQIRVVDPSNQRLKSVTIRQDFTDKL
jgi:hypothetical protein